MRILRSCCLFLICFSSIHALCQQIVSAPEPQPGSIIGTVTDLDEDAIPGATVTLSGDGSDPPSVVTNQDGFFVLKNVRPSVSYRVKVNAKGFGDWTSSVVNLRPGQDFDLADIKLTLAVVETTVSAVSQEQLAIEQVKDAEKQRVFGVIPNFYVAYDPNTVPLSSKLKFELAARSATDAVSIAGAAFIAGINQAADTPAYQQGWKGYGQRFGASYADGVSNILIGGALLPSLLHQDPRYFYQGTGTTKSRMLHAVSAPFWARGDNGKWGFNYSSIGGDLASSSLSNLYYPPQDRGAGLLFENVGLLTAGRIANAMVQEFILPKFTSHSKDHRPEDQ